jgi:hypothetical protein
MHTSSPSRRDGYGLAAQRSEVLGMIARHAQYEVRTKRIMGVENPVLGQCFDGSSSSGAMAASNFIENRLSNRDVFGELHAAWMSIS